ncbi:MAG: YigZ family protein [Bacteroidales bacterium]|nr:YigZ family protein [Bacteroidales bacterium]
MSTFAPLTEIPDTYTTIAAASEGLYKEKGSRFLAFAYPVADAEEVRQRMEALKKRFYDARHHTYAYVLGYRKEQFRLNDDGEPSGTAGRPIYGQIQALDLTFTMVAVVRYFGGIKLGTGGLTKAYKTAAAEALQAATTVCRPVLVPLSIACGYDKLSLVMRRLKEVQVSPQQPQMSDVCRLEIAVPKAVVEAIRALNQEPGIQVQAVS